MCCSKKVRTNQAFIKNISELNLVRYLKLSPMAGDSCYLKRFLCPTNSTASVCYQGMTTSTSRFQVGGWKMFFFFNVDATYISYDPS